MPWRSLNKWTSEVPGQSGHALPYLLRLFSASNGQSLPSSLAAFLRYFAS